MDDIPQSLRAKSTGGQVPSRSRISVAHQQHFTDHAGNPSIMAYRGTCSSVDTPLAPLFSFQVYVTNGTTAQAAGDMPIHFLDSLQRASVELTRCRLDTYFLSGASVQECMAHYRAEKIARAQSALHVVPSYEDDAAPYSNFAIVIEEPEWEQLGVSVVRFDPPEEVLSSPDRAAIISSEVIYEQHVPVKGPLSLAQQVENPRLVPLATLCSELYRQSRFTEEYEDRYDEESERGRQEW